MNEIYSIASHAEWKKHMVTVRASAYTMLTFGKEPLALLHPSKIPTARIHAADCRCLRCRVLRV